MATGPVRNALNVYRITDDALPLLREKILEAYREESGAETNGCIIREHSQPPVKACLDIVSLNDKLDRIFRDKLLDPIEAPRFHKIMGVLKTDVIDRVAIERFDFRQATNTSLDSTDVKKDIAEAQSHGDISKISLFAPDDARRAELQQQLRRVGIKLSGEKSVLEALYFKVRRREDEEITSFSRFVGPTNMWGLSVLFADGKTFTSSEVDGILEMIESLSTLWLGARMLEIALAREEGLPLGNRAVQAFLRSPFADFAQLDYFFSVDDKKKPVGRREWQEALKALGERSGVWGLEFRKD